MKKIFAFLTICLSIQYSAFAQTKVLFDALKAESAANADWVIDADVYNVGYGTGVPTVGGSGIEANAQRIPTPSQNGISANTLENYWTGGLSAWAVECAKKGMIVESLPIGGKITFGDASNQQDLSKYQVYVVCEPNIPFSESEKTAIMKFVDAGGGLFMIANHLMSDRNFDGFDSPMIWNDLMSNNTVKNNPFGFAINGDNISQTTSNIANLPTNPILNGTFGKVTQIRTSGGNTLTINTSQNATVTPLVYRTGSTNDNAVLVASATFGKGRVFVICDSSLPDDGTGDPNDVLYDGWIADANGNHRTLIMNATLWLANNQVAIAATANNTNVACKGNNSGKISLTTSGGTGTYNYLWSNGSTANPAINLKAGFYSVTITSGTQTKVLSNLEVKEPAATLLGEISVPNMLDCKNTSVKLLGTASGGTVPYTYTWSALTQGTSISQGIVTQAGIYNLLVSDSQGCTALKTATVISDLKIPDVTINVTSITCSNPAMINAGSNTSNVVYSWSGPNNFTSNKKDITTTISGVYNLTLTNTANNCSITKSVSIFENITNPNISLSTNQITCAKPNASLNASSTTLNAIYLWSGPNNFMSSKKDTFTTKSGVYTCIVSNPANGCSIKNSVTITENGGKLPMQVSLKTKIDASDTPGLAEITVKEGLAPYLYVWRNAQNQIIGTNSPLNQQLWKGVYTCEVTDANGCKTLYTVVINQILATQDINNQLFIKITPNPVQDLLTVQSEDNLPIIIYSLTGKKLMAANTNQAIDVAFLPKGIYIVVANQQYILKFVK